MKEDDKIAGAASSEIKPDYKIPSALDPGSAGHVSDWPSSWISVNTESLAERQGRLDKAEAQDKQ